MPDSSRSSGIPAAWRWLAENVLHLGQRGLHPLLVIGMLAETLADVQGGLSSSADAWALQARSKPPFGGMIRESGPVKLTKS